MSDHARQQEAEVNNGQLHEPDREALLHALIWTEQDEAFVNEVIGKLNKEPYSTFLHHPAYQARFAHIKKHNVPLYKGKLLKAVCLYSGPQQGMQWDREIDVFVYSQDRLVTVPLSSIEKRMYRGYDLMPLNKLTLVEGDPEGGKTYLLLAISAAVTQGFCLPDQEGRVAVPHLNAGNVLYLTAEDLPIRSANEHSTVTPILTGSTLCPIPRCFLMTCNRFPWHVPTC